MSQFRNRPSMDIAVETGAAALYGAMLGLESEAGGNMAVTGATLDMALRRFMDDVAAEGGEDLAALYAGRLMKTLQEFVPHATGMKTKGGPS